MLGQGEVAFQLRAIGGQPARAAALVATADVQDEADKAVEGGDGAAVAVVGPHGLTAGGAVGVQRAEVFGAGRLGAWCLSGHEVFPAIGLVNPSQLIF